MLCSAVLCCNQVPVLQGHCCVAQCTAGAGTAAVHARCGWYAGIGTGMPCACSVLAVCQYAAAWVAGLLPAAFTCLQYAVACRARRWAGV